MMCKLFWKIPGKRLSILQISKKIIDRCFGESLFLKSRPQYHLTFCVEISEAAALDAQMK